MLEKFGILIFSEYLSEVESELVVRALSDFYHNLTPKHQKRILLNWVTPASQGSKNIHEISRMYSLPNKIINVAGHAEKGDAMRNSTLFLHPSSLKIKKLLSEVLSYGLPVLSIENSSNQDYLDVTCGMFLTAKSNEQLIIEITEKIDMLYHDQEVLKFLKKGAFAQYEKKFGWGLKEFRKPLF